MPMRTRGRSTPRALTCTNNRGAAVNAGVDTREIDQALTCINKGHMHKQGERCCEDRRSGSQPSGVDLYSRGGSLTAPALAEETASVESASGAERAAVAQHKALETKAYDEASREGEMAP